MLSETGQAVLLERIFSELSGVDVEVASWYSVYDIDYIGEPAWFQDAFSKLGILKQDGTAKEVFAAWNAAYETRNPFKPRKKKSGGCSLGALPLSLAESTGALLPLILLMAILFLKRVSRLNRV